MKLSWTGFDTLTNCGFRYELKYEKRVKAGTADQKVFIVGRVIHDIVKAWVQAGYPMTGTFCQDRIKPELVAALQDSRTGPVTADEARTMAVKVTNGLAAVQKIYAGLRFREHRAVIEQWFTVQFVPGLYLNGAADVYDPVTKTVFDLKNYTSSSSKGDIRQLLTYVVAMELQHREVEKVGFIYPFRNPSIEVHPVDQEALAEHRKALLAGAKRITDKAFGPPTPGNHCFFCEYRATVHCPATYTKAIPFTEARLAELT